MSETVVLNIKIFQGIHAICEKSIFLVFWRYTEERVNSMMKNNRYYLKNTKRFKERLIPMHYFLCELQLMACWWTPSGFTMNHLIHKRKTLKPVDCASIFTNLPKGKTTNIENATKRSEVADDRLYIFLTNTTDTHTIHKTTFSTFWLQICSYLEHDLATPSLFILEYSSTRTRWCTRYHHHITNKRFIFNVVSKLTTDETFIIY